MNKAGTPGTGFANKVVVGLRQWFSTGAIFITLNPVPSGNIYSFGCDSLGIATSIWWKESNQGYC
jgi:hypothetical protein